MKRSGNIGAARTKARIKRSGSACEYLGVTPFVLAQLVEIGRVKLTRPAGGGRPFFSKEDLDAYLATSKSELA
jgi:excisionase family DNA binding protein